ncbi:uncharacterized protein LOC109851947 [Pseudomyrmex gracilis]|uniref:uncharacterized protein LOC109851947 n=1 Tax=Pseudomyrmex gracilis TaxID=219809 RepID=UPI000995BCDE|nr:uncharacterized protein LOC109851947 [Pseudomyrmex gracilis]
MFTTYSKLSECKQEYVSSESIEEITESVDELREKLAHMRKLMEARNVSSQDKQNDRSIRKSETIIIDGSFLSWIFGVVLALILSVSFYAFYNLYTAVMKRFPPYHTEL